MSGSGRSVTPDIVRRLRVSAYKAVSRDERVNSLAVTVGFVFKILQSPRGCLVVLLIGG